MFSGCRCSSRALGSLLQAKEGSGVLARGTGAARRGRRWQSCSVFAADGLGVHGSWNAI